MKDMAHFCGNKVFAVPLFFSMDYFSILPWGFLFIAGYFTFRLCKSRKIKYEENHICLKYVESLGKYSLPA